ncbi:MAG TPA: hypothetical protein VKM55_26625 [Candidatus Lokiarchaeia archaeon]|nr:hypothetical protein [Candidatus Lokiarchaeia archaeon]
MLQYHLEDAETEFIEADRIQPGEKIIYDGLMKLYDAWEKNDKKKEIQRRKQSGEQATTELERNTAHKDSINLEQISESCRYVLVPFFLLCLITARARLHDHN